MIKAAHLYPCSFLIRISVSPEVPQGAARRRVCLTSVRKFASLSHCTRPSTTASLVLFSPKHQQVAALSTTCSHQTTRHAYPDAHLHRCAPSSDSRLLLTTRTSGRSQTPLRIPSPSAHLAVPGAMSSRPATPRSSRSGRFSARPRSRISQDHDEPPLKKRKYVPGGPGGGGRFIAADELETPAPPSSSIPRPRSTARRTTNRSRAPPLPRERSTRARTSANRREDTEFSSAAAVAAAVAQNEGYKPREERGWEEFHPNLDIEATFMVFHSEDVDGTRKSTPPPPSQNTINGASTPTKQTNMAVAGVPGDAETPADGAVATTPTTTLETPMRRRTTRPRDAVSFYATRSDLNATPKTPKILSTLNQTPKERLDLKNPSYRKTDRILLFESKTFGQAKYVEKAMMNVGYQESDNFIRPERRLLKASDAHIDEDVDQLLGQKAEGEVVVSHSGSNLGRVEYDMDEQDDMWLETLNVQRKAHELEPVTREIFEITITKIEKEWHVLEKKIPKPNPKPPQTHRPRSSSAVAVNGEQPGEEQDSKCAICDDGDCENTNAIVFCDGCDLAVHQECYGVPFIPEGQWMCRKCQLAGRGIPVSYLYFCLAANGAT